MTAGSRNKHLRHEPRRAHRRIRTLQHERADRALLAGLEREQQQQPQAALHWPQTAQTHSHWMRGSAKKRRYLTHACPVRRGRSGCNGAPHSARDGCSPMHGARCWRFAATRSDSPSPFLGTAFSMGYSHSILRWAKRPSSSSSFLLNPLYGACTKTVLTELLANRLNLPGRYSLDIHLG